MEIHQLKYFLAVAQSGSFTAAAKACHVSQPSLSAQIAKLEGELGGNLVERNRRGARLTPRGELFRTRASEVLRQLEQGRREMEEMDGLKRGSVVLGCLPTTGAYLLPPLLKAFGGAHPEIQVNLREESSPQLAQWIRERSVDLAILDEAGLGPGLQSQILFKEPLLVAVPPGHRLAAKRRVALAALAKEPFILMKSGHGFRKIMVEAMARAGFEPRVVHESGEIETVQALVEAGLGISLVPRMVRQRSGPAYLLIAPPTPSRTLLIAWREGSTLSPAAHALKAVAVEVLNPSRQ